MIQSWDSLLVFFFSLFLSSRMTKVIAKQRRIEPPDSCQEKHSESFSDGNYAVKAGGRCDNGNGRHINKVQYFPPLR